MNRVRETEVQQLIREAVGRLVRDSTADGIPSGRDMDGPVWGAAVDSSLTALVIAESDGGLGLGATELCIVAEELGRGLMAGSFVWTAVVPALLVSAAADSELRRSLLEKIATGDRTLALADFERNWRGVYDRVATTATVQGKVHIINGDKSNVCICDQAQVYLVTAELSGSTGLFVVPADADGVEVRTFDTLDAGKAAEVSLKNVVVPPDGHLTLNGENRSARQLAWDLALLGVVAECVGNMKAMIRITADYIRERKQFGKPLARFQVLRHRMADMALARMAAEALMVRTAEQFAALSPEERSRLVAAAISKAFGGARYVAEQAVHLHGGMGVTEEVPVGRYLRRVLALQAMCGSVEYFQARFGRTAASTQG